MNKKTLINKVNEALKLIWEDDNKAKQFVELCRDYKINTTYNDSVLLRCKPTMSYKELDILIDIMRFVLQ